jgi:hypothetical protein
VWGPGGVLENALKLMGFDNLMFNLYDDPNLVREVFDRVAVACCGITNWRYRSTPSGVIMCNDDWGHKTQTVMSPAHMREYVFGWHKRRNRRAQRRATGGASLVRGALADYGRHY